ncbi:DUF2808 domain-containing protein [Anabaena sp. CA = ATCC 33047]|uniref:DUF2808 domain-containing protein n=1 Tax=Anabaena sp. (strain CA / ATCC 33047) TaxID=52271 RepID=UPI0008338893|nr:DUF2808 domain-containing protein [Anabaena sp. CA = ATCC 33047]
MRLAVVLGRAIATTAIITGYIPQPSQAIQLQDGTVYFAQPPRLVAATTTYNEVYAWGAKYYFTISVPENAGEPLQKITINQREGVDHIHFDLKNSFAFVGTRANKGEKIKLKDVTSDRNTRTISINFEPPISPGKTITIGLKPWRNPAVAGVYLFGVTAVPLGEKTHNQFLGFGRLHFYQNRSNYFPFLYGW